MRTSRGQGASRKPPENRATLQAALGIVTLVSGGLATLLYWQAPWLSESFFQKPAAADIDKGSSQRAGGIQEKLIFGGNLQFHRRP